ncbi:MAG: transcriptional regulator, partial [Pseudonocardiaceae bacterium]
TIYDSRAVLLGTLTATAIVTDQKDVNDYEEHWAELKPIISYDDAARAAIERVTADYRSIT